MKEGKRQKQVGSLINKEINDILQRLGLSMIDGGMVSVSAVRITPDLLEARIYLSFFKIEDPAAALKRIEDRGWEIKKELANRIKLQLRRIPEIKYFADDTLDHVFKMEDLFKKIRDEEEGNKQQ
ncbi:MAG: 30S ribosome-binding factor RbfA [Chitinophagaceae bacterium]|nr:30S ribosome-binding factor RbfA [Chitinophagaceae bacterium]MBN8668887.1 30S ribosome-binding factor RbfA [Chitinophagales bacterium]